MPLLFPVSHSILILFLVIGVCHTDEILTLALLMDTDGDGYITWGDFYAFCTFCDDAQRHHMNTLHCFECLFAELLHEKTSDICRDESLGDLIKLTGILRQKAISTMQILLESIDSHENDASIPAISIERILRRISEAIHSGEILPLKPSNSRPGSIFKFPDIFGDEGSSPYK